MLISQNVGRTRLIFVLAFAIAVEACSTDAAPVPASVAASTSDPRLASASVRALLPTPTELPGSGWLVVGDDDFRQFDLPADTTNVIEECRETVARTREIERLQKQRTGRAVRLYRSSKATDSVQAAVYLQAYSDADQRQVYLDAAVAADTGESMNRCFTAANSSADTKASVIPTEARFGAPNGGRAFAREARFTAPNGVFAQRFETYWWIDGDIVMQVQFVGPPALLGGELIEATLKLVQSKLDARP